MSAQGISGCLCNVLSIVSTEESTESSSFQVVHLCSNTLDCSCVNFGNFVITWYTSIISKYVIINGYLVLVLKYSGT